MLSSDARALRRLAGAVARPVRCEGPPVCRSPRTARVPVSAFARIRLIQPHGAQSGKSPSTFLTITPTWQRKTMLRVLLLFSLVLTPAWPLRAQFMPELPRDEAELIRLLETDQSKFTKAKACQRLSVVGTGASVSALTPLLKDPQLTTYARTALQRIPAPEAEEALVAALDSLDGEPLAGVLHSIGERRIDHATPAITDLLQQDRSKDVQLAAIRTLGKIGERRAAEYLTKYAGETPSEPVRTAIASALLACADAAVQRDEVAFAESLLEQIGKVTPESATAGAARHWRLLREAASQPEAIRRELSAGSKASFRSALQAARQTGPSAAPVIASALGTLPPERKALVLRCLADLGNASVLDQVTPLIASDQPEVVRGAVIAAAKLGRWDDDAQLPDIATSDSPLSRFTLNQLASLGNPNFDAAVVEHLRSLASGSSQLPKSAAVGVMEYAAKRHLTPATEPLLKLTRSDDADLASAALRAAGATTSVEYFPELLRRLHDSSAKGTEADETEAIQQATVRLPQEEAASAIASVMQESSTAQKAELLNYLSLLGGQRALQVVSNAARSDDDALVDAATRVLGEWLTADVASTLSELVRDLDSPKYRRRVLRGYLRVGRQLDMPIEARVELAADAYQLARRDEERQLALDILRRHPSHQGLEWLAEQIKSDSAASSGTLAHHYRTLAAVAQRVAQDTPQQVRRTLQNVPFESAPNAAADTLRTLSEDRRRPDSK